MKRHTISVLVNNHPGVLQRVAGLFGRRGFNIDSIVESFRASIVDIGLESLIIQVIGDQDKINSLIELLRPYGILELTRTGLTAMSRGEVADDLLPFTAMR
jgi:acetolactate synthase small subunit